jgi:hypothetical protein
MVQNHSQRNNNNHYVTKILLETRQLAICFRRSKRTQGPLCFQFVYWAIMFTRLRRRAMWSRVCPWRVKFSVFQPTHLKLGICPGLRKFSASCHISDFGFMDSTSWESANLHPPIRKSQVTGIPVMNINTSTSVNILGLGGPEITYKIVSTPDKVGISKLAIFSVRFEVFTAVTLRNAVFWNFTLCGSCKISEDDIRQANFSFQMNCCSCTPIVQLCWSLV